MPRKPTEATTPLDQQLDAALGGILSAGWDDPLGSAVAQVNRSPDPLVNQVREYPPLPVREDAAPAPRAKKAPPKEPVVVMERQPNGGALMRTVAEDDEEPPLEVGVFNVGALADLASGRMTPDQVASQMGVELGQLQSELAVALRDMDPKDIAKAMGLQAAEQQLKSGAVYGAILADLVADIAAGRLKPDQKIELAKMLAKVGRIEPKEDRGAVAGQGFVLNISMGTAPQPITIDSN